MSKKQSPKSLFGGHIIKPADDGSPALLLALLAFLFLSIYTRHGQQVEIPSLGGLQAEEANRLLHAKGLHARLWTLSISAMGAGCRHRSDTKAGNKVKEGRAIYITIYSRTPQMVSVPELVDYSTRQAMAMLTSMGFNQIAIEEIPAEYAGLVVAVKYHGRPLAGEEKIPAASPITLVVTKAFDRDSLSMENDYNSLPQQPTNGQRELGNGNIDDTFFKEPACDKRPIG